jgi:hypothetical protein
LFKDIFLKNLFPYCSKNEKTPCVGVFLEKLQVPLTGGKASHKNKKRSLLAACEGSAY